MSPTLKSYFQFWIIQWNGFWFGPRDLYILSLFRVCLGVILLTMYSVRFVEIELFYFNTGLVDTETVKTYFHEFGRPLFYLFPHTDFLIYLFHALFLVGLFLLTIGLSYRIFIFGIFLLQLCFIERNPFIVYGTDLCAAVFLFYLCFMKSGAHFNLITLIGRRYFGFKKRISEKSDILTSMGVRLMQVQLCIIYGTAGLAKLKGEKWWEGSAIWYITGNQQVAIFDFSFIYHVPVIIALLTFSVLAFEIYFPIAIWQKKLRPLWILFGITLHLFTSLFLNLFYFGLVMTASYLFWVRREDFTYIKSLIIKRMC